MIIHKFYCSSFSYLEIVKEHSVFTLFVLGCPEKKNSTKAILNLSSKNITLWNFYVSVLF